MYELPVDFDEAILIGCYLEMVCIGPYVTNLIISKPQLSFGCSRSITVSVKGPISFVCDRHSYVGNPEEPRSMVALVDLLMKEIVKVQRIGKASLQIFFESEGHVTLEGENSPQFEVYSIQIPGNDIVIV